MSLSNPALLSVATGFSEYGIREIFSNNKKRYTTLSANYRQALKLNKNVSKVRKNIEKHLERDGMIVFVSPRNKNSEFLGNVLNLTEDGIYNLRILRYLLSRHYFLVSTSLALVSGSCNEQTANSAMHRKFSGSKEDFLNSISRHDSKIRLETFLKTQFEKLKFDKNNISEILESMEIR